MRRGSLMKIDIFNHLFPRRFFDDYINTPAGPKDIGKRVREAATIVDLDARFRVMDEFGEYCQVLSLPLPPLEALGGPDKTPQMARMVNDGFAELCRKYPERFPSFIASLPMNNLEASLAESERAVKQLGARGVQVYTNVKGKPLDADDVLPLFEELARRGTVIWMHPARGAEMTDYLSEDKSKYEIWWTFGWPYETSAAMARLVFSGIFDRQPDLKIITHHMGGMVPYFEGRVGYGWDQLGKRTSDTDYTVLLKKLKKRPLDYFKMFYADTALFGGFPATQCGLAFFGLDRVLFASDVPFEPSPGLYIRETIRCIEGLGLNADDKQKIYQGNAERLLNMSQVAKSA
ncbi:MAG: amidohydrolase [Acidobacteriia bacterium]|nr:amidohydrolase [Terriglobia bacterium]